jgi:hypothetical protein
MSTITPDFIAAGVLPNSIISDRSQVLSVCWRQFSLRGRPEAAAICVVANELVSASFDVKPAECEFSLGRHTGAKDLGQKAY